MKRIRVRAMGRVQGVGFREATRSRAEVLGLAGWIRNLGEDCVEAVFEGPADAVDAAIDFVRSGPSLALVRRLDLSEEPAEGDAAGFRIVV